MRPNALHRLFLTSTLLAFCCGHDTLGQPTPPEEPEALVQGNSAFAVDLYQQLRQADGNLCFSPYSISTALAMTYAGARGQTETQMLETLHFPADRQTLHPAFAALQTMLRSDRQTDGVTLDIASSLWPDVGCPLLNDYSSLVRKYYGVSIRGVDYARPRQACDTINQWISRNTRDRIKQIIEPSTLDKDTEMILVNAVYFKARWRYPFDPDQTKSGRFHLNSDHSVKVSMMRQFTYVPYAEAEHLQIVELPYADKRFSMLILLPRETETLRDIEDCLSAEAINNWKTELKKTMVIVGLPRFLFETHTRLEKPLKAMGMKNAFERSIADFSGLTERNELFLNQAIHSAFVEVNEQGTTATGASLVGTARASASRPPTFWADRPFLFLIQERSTGTILFLGRLLHPTQTL